MSKTTRAGVRIADWFLWIECEVAKTDRYRKVPLVTVREATSGGDILAEVVGTRALANDLRKAADGIDKVIDGLNPGDEAEGVLAAE